MHIAFKKLDFGKRDGLKGLSTNMNMNKLNNMNN